MDPKAALTTAPAQTGGGHGRSTLNTNESCCVHFCGLGISAQPKAQTKGALYRDPKLNNNPSETTEP